MDLNVTMSVTKAEIWISETRHRSIFPTKFIPSFVTPLKILAPKKTCSLEILGRINNKMRKQVLDSDDAGV